MNAYLSWGAGPRASQYLVVGAKVNAALNGKYSPDIEDVKAVATPILRHRIVRNYKAEAEGHTVESIIRRVALRETNESKTVIGHHGLIGCFGWAHIAVWLQWRT